MRVDGANVRPRMFLLSIALLVGLAWGVGEAVVLERPGFMAWGYGMLAAKSLVILTYIEILGVWFFSNRKRWPMTLLRSERVGCYAATGWVAAYALIWLYYAVWRLGWLDKALASSQIGDERWIVAAGFVVVAGAAMMGFETLVWIGARQVRYANSEKSN